MKSEETGPGEIPGRPQRGSRAIGWVGLLVALVALAASAGFFFQTRAEQRELGRIGASLVNQHALLTRLEQERVTQAQFAHLVTRLDTTRHRVRQLQDSVLGITRDAQDARIEERIRESQMLVAFAQHILAVEPDRMRWALRILETVRGLIRPLGSPALAPAQKILDARIRLIKAARAAQTLEPAQVLGSLSRVSPVWPFAIPHPPRYRIHPVMRSAGGFWSRIGDGVSAIFHDLVRIHRVPVRTAPPPGAREARLIRLNLALDFSLAQTAWLTSDRAAYFLELGILREMIGREYDLSDPRVLTGWRRLGALAHAPWPRPEPGLQPLLHELHAGAQELRRGQP
ncbi:MAG: hypothetical protein ACYCS1_09825 [Gammaproteobacteria bacterium]